MGEKFSANPVTGTGSMSLPISTSPGRIGVGPQLSLWYDSGSGNGPFGFGWSLSLPAITRKTDKGLPLYRDTEESDVFLLSSAEDLVPVLVGTEGNWERLEVHPRTIGEREDRVEYRIECYRPRNVACPPGSIFHLRHRLRGTTYRQCRRVLMFHHFSELRWPDYLVRSTDFTYNYKGNLVQAERRLANAYAEPVIHWSEVSPEDGLDVETFV